jgi:hypothetical protein
MTYTQSGYMSTTVASADPGLLPPDLNLTYPSQEGQSDADWAKAGKHTLSYAGPWSVQEAVPGVPATEESGQILHGPLTVAHIPALIGTRQRRNYTIIDMSDEGRFLWISQQNGTHESHIWWKRLD